jgi:hypothetical protein
MELRLYSFINFYLSSIQQGIQTGHAAVRLVRKYSMAGAQPLNAAMANDWADNHETFICLNGGDDEGIEAARLVISKSFLPWCEFEESKGALNRLRTCVAVVVPECIFAARFNPELSVDGNDVYSSEVDGNLYTYNQDDDAYDLIKLLRSSGLAK